METTSVLTMPVPGWYPDPVGAAAYRWWDGQGWTEGTHAQQEFSFAPEPVVEREPVPPMQLFAEVPPTASPVQPVAQAAAPPLQIAPESRRQPVRRGSAGAKTRWSSLLAAFPVVYPIVLAMIVGLAYAGGAASSMQTLIIIGAIAAVGLLTPAFVFADHDRRELIARGYEPAPSIAWMLLLPPIAYLIARRRIVGPSY